MDSTIDIYKNKLKSNISSMVEQEIVLNQSISDVMKSRTGGFRSMHAGQLYKFNPMNSVFSVMGDPTSGHTVGP